MTSIMEVLMMVVVNGYGGSIYVSDYNNVDSSSYCRRMMIVSYTTSRQTKHKNKK